MDLHPVEALYRRRFEEARSLDAKEADYHALEQGEYGTELRHEAVLDHVSGLDGRVLDLGCGTGLLVEKMVARGLKPTSYLGIDGMPEREAPLLARLTRLGVNGRFQLKPMDVRFEDITLPVADAALFVGLMGFWGYHTQRHVGSIYRKLRCTAAHGCITFPMIWHPQHMGGGYYRRWEPTDVQDLLGLKSKNLILLEREFVVAW